MKIIGTALMALGLLLLSGCTSQPASITVDDLYGTWEKDGESQVTQYNEDGTYIFAHNKFVLLDERPIAAGEFRLEGNLLIMTSDKHRLPSCLGLTATYDITLTEEGKLHSKVVEDECSARAEDWNDKLWSRISP